MNDPSSSGPSSSGKRLLVLGAGGHGHVVADLAHATGRFDEIAFLDDKIVDGGRGHWPVVGQLKDFQQEAKVPGTVFALGIGDNAARLKWLGELSAAGVELPVLAHPSAAISEHANLGAGCVVMAQAAINIGAQLGQGCVVNTSASVDHDCVLGDGVHISPGAHLGGNVHVGHRSWVGVGASVRHGLTIGAGVMVGAGAAVVGDLAGGCTAVGVPAKARDPEA